MEFHTTTRIWLKPDEYIKKGLTQDAMIEAIKLIQDPGEQLAGLSFLRASKAGLNHNIIVETKAPTHMAQEVINTIKSRFSQMLLISEMTS